MQLKISARAIRAVMNHAAECDVRSYLNAVILRPARGGGVLAIASDGYRLAICHDLQGESDGEGSIILSRDRDGGKAKGWKDSALLHVSKAKSTRDNQDPLVTVIQSETGSEVEFGGVKVSFNPLDFRIPDFHGVIARSYAPNRPPALNARYLIDACESAAIVRNDKYCALQIHGEAERQAQVFAHDKRLKLFVLIMCVRDGINYPAGAPVNRPDYLSWIDDVM